MPLWQTALHVMLPAVLCCSGISEAWQATWPGSQLMHAMVFVAQLDPRHRVQWARRGCRQLRAPVEAPLQRRLRRCSRVPELNSILLGRTWPPRHQRWRRCRRDRSSTWCLGSTLSVCRSVLPNPREAVQQRAPDSIICLRTAASAMRVRTPTSSGLSMPRCTHATVTSQTQLGLH